MDTTTCHIDGHPDIYGLGIRLGFYLQWYGAILASWLAPGEVRPLRHTNAVFLAATLVSLIALRHTLSVPEAYIVQMFLFGSALYVVPKAGLRLLSWNTTAATTTTTTGDGRAHWGLPVYAAAPPRRKTFGLLWSALVVASLLFALWFWLLRVPVLEPAAATAAERRSCGAYGYGFLFARVPLTSFGLHLFHGFLGVFMIGATGYLMMQDIAAKRPRKLQVEANSRFQLLRLLVSFTELYVAVVITIAIEFTITWNGIRGVHSVNTAAQLIPTLIGIGAILRIFYVFLFGEDGDPLETGFSSADFKLRVENMICRPVVFSRLPEYRDYPPHEAEAEAQGDAGSMSSSMSHV
ncbi:COP9 signalosome (CSN) subunit [Hypoxylon texense]